MFSLELMMKKRSGYPSVEQFRTQIAPYVEVGGSGTVVCGMGFSRRKEEWAVSLASTRNIDALVGAICGYPAIFNTGPTNPRGPLEAGIEEWWRRRIAEARAPR